MALSEERLAGQGGVIQATPEQLPQQSTLTSERQASLLAYCKLTELADDPEVVALIQMFYEAAVGYMEDAGVGVPKSGTPRAARYDLVVNRIVLDAWERRETAVVATVVADNPAFRQMLNQLKLTEPGVSL